MSARRDACYHPRELLVANAARLAELLVSNVSYARLRVKMRCTYSDYLLVVYSHILLHMLCSSAVVSSVTVWRIQRQTCLSQPVSSVGSRRWFCMKPEL